MSFCVILPKTSAYFKFFFIFCHLRFINDLFFEKKSFWIVKSPEVRYLETHLFSKKKTQTYRFVKLSTQISCQNFFFFLNVSSRIWNFCHGLKTTNLVAISFHKKLILHFFIQLWLFNFNTILKTCFWNLCRKTEKKMILLFQKSCSNPTNYLNYY